MPFVAEKSRYIGIFFAFMGFSLLMGGYYAYKSTVEFQSSALHGQGQVTQLVPRHTKNGITYAPTVKFHTSNGQEVEFTSSVSSKPSHWRVGDHVDVLYQPDMPTRAKINSFAELWTPSLIFAGIGTVFSLIGSLIVGGQVLASRRREWLRMNGTRIQGAIIAVQQNPRLRINGRCPFVIEYQWSDPTSGKVYTGLSENLWYNPEVSGGVKVGDEVIVFMNPRNPKQSWINIDQLRARAA